MAETRNDQEKAKQINSYFTYLKKVRQPFEETIDDILEFVRRSRKINDSTKGNKITKNVYDGTATGALNLWADGMYGYIYGLETWFSLILPNIIQFPRFSTMRRFSGKRLDEVPEVGIWLENTTEVLRAAFRRGNFYAAMPQFLRDGGSVGTAALYVQEDIVTGKTTYTPLHFREIFIDRDHLGNVDVLFRKYKLTLRQMVQKWGLQTVLDIEPGMKLKLENNEHQEMPLLHAVYPRKEYDPSARDNKNMPWASCWKLEGSGEKIIQESGYPYFPFIVWGYRRETDEIYARSPAWDAYVEIGLANQQGRSNLIAGQKMAEPPMIGPNGLRGKVHSGPKGWTWVDGKLDVGSIPTPLVTGINLPYALEMQDRTAQVIEKHYNVPFFLMLSQAAYNKVQLTATQVIQMAGEQAAVLATRTDTLNIEASNPIIDVQFEIEKEAGRLPEPPDILLEYSGAQIEVDYLGPLAQARKTMFETQGIRAGIELAGQIGMVFPESLRVIDGDDLMRRSLKATAFPATSIRSPEKVEEINQAMQKQLQDQQAMEGIETISKAIPKAGKAPEEGSPLANIMGGGV